MLRRFNLFREESEGFAKVFTTLHDWGAGASADSHAKGLVRLLRGVKTPQVTGAVQRHQHGSLLLPHTIACVGAFSA